jgi:lysophospholipase L1-like esterase
LSERGTEDAARTSRALTIVRRIVGSSLCAALLYAALDGAVEVTRLAAGWKGTLHAAQIAMVAVPYLGALLAGAALVLELCTPPPDGLAALARKLFAALVATWLWFVFFSPFGFSPAMLGVGAGLLAALFGGARVLAAGRSRRWSPSARRRLDLAVFSLCATAVLSEVALRALSHARPSHLLARESDDPLAALRGWRLAPASLRFGFPANAAGHYDDPFTVQRAKPRRVAVIGDSFSIGAVPHALHFTTLAEGLLGDTEVLNLGISGVGPAEYEALLEHEALALQPDLVVVCLFAGNDLGAPEIRPTGVMGALSEVLDRRDVLIHLVPSRLARIAEEREQLGTSRVAISQGAYDVPLAADATPAQLEAALPFLADPMLEQPTQAKETFLRLELSRLRDVATAEERVYQRLIARCARMRDEARPAPLAIVLIPDEFQVEDALWSELAALAPEQGLERNRFQREVGSELARRGIPVVDLLPLLRAAQPLSDGRLHVYHLNDTHFNARGNRIAADALAELVRTLLPRAP